jgi:hypothetical protein
MSAPETPEAVLALYLQALRNLSPLCTPLEAIIYLDIVDRCLDQRAAGCWARVGHIAQSRRLPVKEVEEALQSLCVKGFFGVFQMRDGRVHFFMPNEQDEDGNTTICLIPEGYREWMYADV